MRKERGAKELQKQKTNKTSIVNPSRSITTLNVNKLHWNKGGRWQTR